MKKWEREREKKNLPKLENGELLKEERDEERELEPQATPRVFWLVFFFLLEGFEFEFEEAELRLLLKLLLADLSERVDSMLIFLWRNVKSVEQAFQRKCFSFSVFSCVCVRFKWSGKMDLLWDIYSGGPNQSHMVTGYLLDHDSWIVGCAWVGYIVKLQPK